MLNCRLICVIALVLVLGAEFGSASLFAWGNKKPKPWAAFKNLKDVPIRYKPEQLFEILGFSLDRPHHEEGVAEILAATSDKSKPNTIANKYSINDLLAMNEIYPEDFTSERFKEKLALCESLSPERVEKPTSGFVKSLMDQNSYRKGERNVIMDKEDRKPHVYMYHKNLYDYCIEAFDEYHHKLRQEMILDQELDSKVKLLEEQVDVFVGTNRRKYINVQPYEIFHAHKVMVDFLKERKPSEVEQIKRTCSELFDKIGFVAERELYRHNFVPVRYNYVYTYCKGIFYGEK